MKSKKVVHIHGDHKFIYDTEKFEGAFFDNQIVILDKMHQYNQAYHNRALFFPKEAENIPDILEVVDKADILVVYALDSFKAQIINGAREGIKIIWRFFGNELYSRKLGLYLDAKTRSYFTSEILMSQLKAGAPFIFEKEKSFRSAIKRIDLIAGIFEEEYHGLVKEWPNLPDFIRFPLQTKHDLKAVENDKPITSKEDVIVVGNSRSYFNNHLEALDLILGAELNKKIKIKVLFNYGKENNYTARIREQSKKSENIELVEDFIPQAEFLTYYDKVAAVVNNSYRQLALGNILLSLRKGVKIYLNPKSPTYHWLNGLGFKIYSTVQLKDDLGCKNISLSMSDAEHNLFAYRDVLNNYTYENFQSRLLQMVNA